MFEKPVMQRNNNYKNDETHGESYGDARLLSFALDEFATIEKLLKTSLAHEHSLPMWSKAATTEDKKQVLSLINQEQEVLGELLEELQDLSSRSTFGMAN